MSFFKQLELSLKQLPGQDAQYKMAPTQRHRIPLSAFNQLNAKKGAVLINLLQENDGLYTYLMKRTNYDGPHGGQISLPGGKYELYDASLSETAIRENEEEIGISKANIEIMGGLTPLYIPVSNFIVFPFISKTNLNHNIAASKIEVAELLKVNLMELLIKDKFKQKVWMETSYGKMQMPCYQYQNHNIWGATAMILSELEAILKSF